MDEPWNQVFKSVKLEDKKTKIYNDLIRKEIQLLDIREQSKPKIDDKWDGNPFTTYKKDYQKASNTNYVLQNIIHNKNAKLDSIERK